MVESVSAWNLAIEWSSNPAMDVMAYQYSIRYFQIATSFSMYALHLK